MMFLMCKYEIFAMQTIIDVYVYELWLGVRVALMFKRGIIVFMDKIMKKYIFLETFEF